MAKDRWTAEKIPNLQDKCILITGSNSGIGYEAARVLAGKGAEIIIAVRSPEKGEAAKQKILSEYASAKIDLMLLDLADLASVRSFAEQFQKRHKKLDILVNNAGVMIPPYGKTKDGFELQFGVNHLGHFALTGLLLETLQKAPGSRIVNIASMAHYRGNINFDDLNWEKRPYNAAKAYGDSKLANLYFTFEMARRLKNNSPLVLAAHPGWTATELMRHSTLMDMGKNYLAMPLWQGTLPTLRACVDPDAQSGDYFGPHAFGGWRGYPVKCSSSKLSKDPVIAKKLWEISEKLTSVNYLSSK
jgi:NAD(P)-dependent dehydrogenase (short-subunit alcohol dehydrogenase family)